MSLFNALSWAAMIVFVAASFFTDANGLPAPKYDANPYGVNRFCESCVCGVRGRGNRIVGGRETGPNEYPWVVGLWRQGTIACGATLVSSSFVMTAAHCVYGLEPEEIRIYLGGHNVSTDYTEVRLVRSIHIHDYFDIISFDNDIALVRLDRAVKFGPKVQPACLPDARNADYDGVMSLVVGWGRVGEAEPTSTVLRSLVVPIWSQEQCLQSEYGENRLTNNMICAGFHDGQRDACKGDSGGPLHIEGNTGSMEIIGLVSFGRGCARPNLPGVYTRVVNYLPWIQRKMAQDCLCSPKQGVRTNYLERLSQSLGK